MGGFPGSGTRVVSRILSLSGIFMGSRTNDTNDSVFFAEFLNHWSGRYISTGAVADDALVERMTQDFNSFLEQHLHGLPPHGRWGAKNPRNILILPFLFSLFPEMKFIHVLRDGRDLAASHKKRIKIKQYARDLMNQEVESTGAMVDLWSAITLRGVGFGEQCMKDNIPADKVRGFVYGPL